MGSDTPFATIYSYPGNPKVMRALVCARLNSLWVEVPEFEFRVANRTDEYKAKFPPGMVPALEMADGFLLFEAHAIAHFLASSGPLREPLLLSSQPKNGALVQQWASFVDHEIYPHVYDAVQPHFHLAPYDAGEYAAAKLRLLDSLSIVEKHLERQEVITVSHDQLGGNGQTRFMVPSIHLTYADLAVISALHWSFTLLLDASDRAYIPHVEDFYSSILATYPKVSDIFAVPALLATWQGPR